MQHARIVQGPIMGSVIAVYLLQILFLQLFVRLEPTMMGVSIPSSVQLLVDAVVQSIPALVFASTALLIFLAMLRSSVQVRLVSFLFLVMMVVDETASLLAGWLYGSLYWLLFSVLVIAFPEVLLMIAALERRSIAAGAITVSSVLASSFYAWSFLSRITFSVPPISLIPISVYAFTVAFALLSATMVKKFNFALYLSLSVAGVLMGLVVYFTSSNLLVQKIINMVLQTSLGAPTPLPWFAPLFFLIIFSDIYSLVISVKLRSLGPLSVAAGATMVFTSVYLPYNMLYAFISFSGALLIFLGLSDNTSNQPKGVP
ncbi:MAG: hypothetical protein ACP5NC_01325 [Nitrososphaeria archaeon]